MKCPVCKAKLTRHGVTDFRGKNHVYYRCDNCVSSGQPWAYIMQDGIWFRYIGTTGGWEQYGIMVPEKVIFT